MGLKVLFVVRDFAQGAGDNTYTFNLVDILKSNGHEVGFFSIIHPSNESSPFSKYFVSAFDYHHAYKKKRITDYLNVAIKSLYSFEAKRKIKSLLGSYKPDIVHIQHLDLHVSLSILGEIKKHNIPIIWTLHKYYPICINSNFLDADGSICESCKPDRYYQAALKKCKKNSFLQSFMGCLFQYFNHAFKLYNHVDAFICPSQFVKNKFIEFGFPSDKLHQISYFTDSSKVVPVYNSQDYGLFFGRLSLEKGLDVLLDALKNTEIPFKIVGDGESKNVYMKMADDLGLDNVEFLGPKYGDELVSVISKARFIVVPSAWYEVVGLVTVEAFACGKPVIGCRIGGIPEIILENKTGLLFDYNNHIELRDKMEKLYSDPELASDMGRHARLWVEKEYNPGLHFNRLMKLYSSFVEKGEV